MRRIITGATGLIGKRLVSLWREQHHEIAVVGRTKEHIKKTFGHEVEAITWDELTIEKLQSAEVVVNLAGKNLADKRWNETFKEAILESRVHTTKQLAGLLAQLGPKSPPLFNASAISIYGLQTQQTNQLPLHVDEQATINWDSPTDFLAKVAQYWEQATTDAVKAGVRVVFLRFGVVLAKEGGALKQLVRPFQFYMGGPLGSGNQPFSWIAIDDAVNAIDFLLSQPNVTGPINLVAPDCLLQKNLAHAIAKVLGRPNAITMPAFMLQLMLGSEMANDLLLEGQNVYPRRLIDLGFHFNYPSIDLALMHLLK